MIFRKKIEDAYKAQLFSIYDDTGIVTYFSHRDFDGLQAEPYTFSSSHGHTLQGYFYSYADCDKERLVIFEHGLGGGHRSYMKEIEKLCSKGYRVFSYDHTGCMESGGENSGGFSQSLCDLDDCLKALKADNNINTCDISVIGHSWGGFSTLNISALHQDVKKIVVLCGPVSIKRMTEQNFHGILRGYQKHILKLEHDSNPHYADYDGIETLKNSDTKALLIYSDNDSIIQRKFHYDALYSALQEKKNVKFLLTSNKGHNPNYTADAVQYLGTLASALKKNMPKTDEEKKSFRNSFDWHRMTAQDDNVWDRIFEFLE